VWNFEWNLIWNEKTAEFYQGNYTFIFYQKVVLVIAALSHCAAKHSQNSECNMPINVQIIIMKSLYRRATEGSENHPQSGHVLF
jgi:hypothetical protein